LADLIDVVNQTRAQRDNLWVLAVDVPSGLDADTGLPSASTVFADATVMLGGAKQGLLLPSAFPYTGTLLFADIDVVDGPIWAPRILYRESAQGLAARPAGDAHKGTFGRLLVVAGSELYVGAALLTCAAAARSGAGIVTLAAPGWLRNIAASRAPEVTFLSLPDGRSDEAAATALDAIASHLAGFTALAIGPGLSMDPYTLTLVEGVLRERARLAIPTVVDADALNALAQIDGWARWSGENLVLTPHPGEFARLAPHRDDGSPPWRQARVGAEEWGVTLVLKGACTVIADPSEVWVHARPNPALATGGTGDVLTGMVGGLLAQGLEPSEAARLAVWAHGEAARRARHGSLDRGLLPSDLLGEIPEALGTVLGPRV
jgi:NAD(P)H-hydrate epimerase